MGENNSSKLKEIFADAIELQGKEREEYLDRACVGDPALRLRVEILLAGGEQTGDILDADSVGAYLRNPPSDALSAGDQIGRFRIIRLIGKGGVGEVYEADDPEYGRRVALKTLRPEFVTRSDFVARFHREIRLAWLVTHPNVCRVYDVGQCDIRGAKSLFLTMELLPGETLAERLRRRPVEQTEATGIFQQIAAGLAALHGARLVHRDLKPSNVILCPSDEGVRCVITDFGLAHQPELEPENERLTLVGQVIGTPAYMSPEQLAGKNIVPQSDIYSLGIVMYEVLCGRRPFEADQIVESAAQKQSRAPRPTSRVKSLDRRWDPLVMKCLEPAIDKRPQNVQELTAKLQAIALHKPDTSFWAKARRALNPSLLPKPVLYGAAAVAIAAVIVPMRIEAIRTPLLRHACRQFPGVAALCELPASKDMAIMPAVSTGANDEDRALAAGFAQYLRESFQRLYPDPGSVCVHLRNDRLADGVHLVVEPTVQVLASNVVVTFTIREQGEDAAGGPLTLRKLAVSIPRSEALRLHWEPVQQLSNLLGAQISPAEWHGWLKLTPGRSESLLAHFAGLGHLQEGRYEDAVQAFSRAIEPGNDFAFAPAHLGLGDAYRMLGNKTHNPALTLRARQAYRRAVPLDRDFGFAGAERRWGELEAGAGETQAAIEHLSNALRFWPYDAGVQRSLAAAYEAATQDRRSEDVLRNAVLQAPHCWLTHNTMANFYSRHARFQEAERELLEVVRLAPQNANAYNNLAFDYIKVGRLDDAIEMASKSIRLGTIPLAYSNLGRAYLYRGCTSDALTHLKKAVELRPKYFIVWANLAEGLYAKDKESEDARASFHKTIELAERELEAEPTFALARAQLALNLARLNQRERALVEIDQALRLSPESHDIMLAATETFGVLGAYPRALSQLERAFPGGLSLHEVQSSFGLAKLRRDPAYAALLKRLKLNPSADPGGVTPRTSKACPESPLVRPSSK